MPCDQVQQTVILFGANTDATMLHAALKELGLQPIRQGRIIYFSQGEYDTVTGEVRLLGDSIEQRMKEMKRSYSAETVKSTAKRFGWQLTQKSRYEFEVVKRRV